MMSVYHEIIQRHVRPLWPLPTRIAPRLRQLSPIRAVLLDVYGTMFISASGEIGLTDTAGHGPACLASMRAVGIDCSLSGEECVRMLYETIESHHELRRNEGIDWPEVDIVDVWRDVMVQLHGRGVLCKSPVQTVDYQHLAIEFEARTNPVWPMPGLSAALASLRSSGLLLGIVSNAQFFTLELFLALLGRTALEAGFDAQLQYYSYRFKRAKPGLFLFERAREDLAARGIKADQIIYVGNDMFNDVLPARRSGFKTALFAGDARSLRLREDDPRLEGVFPDAVLTELGQLSECLVGSS